MANYGNSQNGGLGVLASGVTQTGPSSAASKGGANSAAGGYGGLIGGLAGGVLGSWLGGGAPTTTPYSSTIQQGAGTMWGQGANTYTAGQGLLNQGTSLAPQTGAAYQQYLQYLNQNPFTSNFDAAQTAAADGNAAQNLAGGNAALMSRLSAMGIAQAGGGPSSVVAGGQTALQQTALGQQDAARNQLAAQSYQQRLQNLGAAANAASDEQSQFIGQGNQTIGTGASLENMSQEQLQQLAQTWLQQQQMNNAQQNGLTSGLGSLISNIPAIASLGS